MNQQKEFRVCCKTCRNYACNSRNHGVGCWGCHKSTHDEDSQDCRTCTDLYRKMSSICSRGLLMVSSQFVASKNGEYFENFVGIMVPGLELTRGDIDAKLDDTDIEIKSCQFEVIDNSHNCRSRSGRFMFRDHQHELLKEKSGDYIFIVHRNGKPLLFIQAPAAAVNLPQFTGTKSLSWRTLFMQLARRI